MKQIIFAAILILVFSFAAFAQSDNASSDKVAAIHSDFLFDEKFGIKVLAEAYRKIDEKLKSTQEHLDVLSVRIQALKKELQNLQNRPAIFQYKLDELESMRREYNFIMEEKADLPRKHKLELISAFKVREALIQFKKKKGYTIIFDRSEIRDSSIIIEENENLPFVTSEFIKFYNNNYAKADLQ